MIEECRFCKEEKPLFHKVFCRKCAKIIGIHTIIYGCDKCDVQIKVKQLGSSFIRRPGVCAGCGNNKEFTKLEMEVLSK